MREEDREIWVGKSRFYLSEDNIIYCKETTIDKDEKIAHLEIDALFKLANLIEGKVNILIDINEAGKPSSGARKVFQKAIEYDKFGKIAVFGMNPVARVMASFIIGATKKKDFSFFKTKEDALKWLKE